VDSSEPSTSKAALIDLSTRVKEEEFFHLLVDVAHEGRDLYDGLDATFDESIVEIDGKKARRRVSLKELPAILQIQLQVRSKTNCCMHDVRDSSFDDFIFISVFNMIE
jgi:hypothetical protein